MFEEGRNTLLPSKMNENYLRNGSRASLNNFTAETDRYYKFIAAMIGGVVIGV